MEGNANEPNEPAGPPAGGWRASLRRWGERIDRATTVFGGIVARLREIWDVLLVARISLLLLSLGCAVLLLDQGRDVVRSLNDDVDQAGAIGPWTGALRLHARWISFWVACVWSGINAWYWPRLLFQLRARAAPFAFRLLTWLLGCVPLLVATITLGKLPDDVRSTAVFAASTILMAAFLVTRKRVFGRDHSLRGWWFNAPPRLLGGGMLRLNDPNEPRVDLTRGDEAFFLFSLALAVALMGLLAASATRTHVSWALGSAGLAFGAIGLIIAGLSAVAWVFDRFRINVLLGGALLFAAFSLFNDNHAVRTLPDRALGARPELLEALRTWEDKLDRTDGGKGPIILAATAGGASRAGYWTSAVLRTLDDRSNGAFGRHLFAISAVSGGSLGAVGYAAWTADHGWSEAHDAACSRPARLAQRLRFEQDFVGGDYLAPAVAGLLYPDLLQRFIPYPFLQDRAQALENGWEQGWRWAANQADAQACGPRQGSNRMAGDFLGIWRDGLYHQDRAWVPLVLVNGTSVETGKRIITAPVAIRTNAFYDAYDFFDLVPLPIRASTAILNGARFPVVSPAGTLIGAPCPHGRIVDGGYFENGGLETMEDLARFIRGTEIGARRQIILIEIDNDVPGRIGDDARGDMARYPNTGGNDPTNTAAGLAVADPPVGKAGFLSEIGGIIGGLYNTRSARAVLTAKRLSALPASITTQPGLTRYTFNLGRLSSAGTTMSWALSLSARDAIDLALDRRGTRTGLGQTLAASVIGVRCGIDADCKSAGLQRLARVAQAMPSTPGLVCEHLGANAVATALGVAAPTTAPGCPSTGVEHRDVGLPESRAADAAPAQGAVRPRVPARSS